MVSENNCSYERIDVITEKMTDCDTSPFSLSIDADVECLCCCCNTHSRENAFIGLPVEVLIGSEIKGSLQDASISIPDRDDLLYSNRNWHFEPEIFIAERLCSCSR